MRLDPFQLENQFGSLPFARQQSLIQSLLGFRQVSLPNLTMMSPARGEAIGNVIRYEGFMEDNAVPIEAILTIQSRTTARYFNGAHWQETPAYISIIPSSSDTSINQWSYVQRIFAETNNNFDVLKSTLVPVDNDGNVGTPITSLNPIGIP